MTGSANAFRALEREFKHAQDQQKVALKHQASVRRAMLVKTMLAETISDTRWDELVEQAQNAANHGAKEYLLLRFPSDLCTDSSRAINNPPNPAWPQTLQGEAADIYHRWDDTLRSAGFTLSALVLDFPDGKPGDVGLFLRWG